MRVKALAVCLSVLVLCALNVSGQEEHKPQPAPQPESLQPPQPDQPAPAPTSQEPTHQLEPAALAPTHSPSASTNEEAISASVTNAHVAEIEMPGVEKKPKFRLGKFLVGTIKSVHKIVLLPLELVKPLNPFAPMTPGEAPSERTGSGDYDTRAWSTIVVLDRNAHPDPSANWLESSWH